MIQSKLPSAQGCIIGRVSYLEKVDDGQYGCVDTSIKVRTHCKSGPSLLCADENKVGWCAIGLFFLIQKLYNHAEPIRNQRSVRTGFEGLI